MEGFLFVNEFIIGIFADESAYEVKNESLGNSLLLFINRAEIWGVYFII